jgi:hypothetical protein
MWYTYGVLVSHKKNEMMSFSGKMIKLEIIMLSGISHITHFLSQILKELNMSKVHSMQV